jgi:hypothetical protein
MNPAEQVEQAFLHLCWSIKLDSYISLNPPSNIGDFDHEIIVTHPEDPMQLPANQFNSIDEIYLGAENTILLSVGAFFLALDTALDESGYTKDIEAKDPFGQLRILIYMVRCAFAHSVLNPHWEVRGKFKRKLIVKIKDISFELDLNTLSGKNFNIDQIGGYSQLMRIKDYIMRMLHS